MKIYWCVSSLIQWLSSTLGLQSSAISNLYPSCFPKEVLLGVHDPLTRILLHDQWLRIHPKWYSDWTTRIHSRSLTFRTSGLWGVPVVKLSKKNFRSDATLVSLDDLSWAEQLPCVTWICDFHIPEMSNQLDTCHCMIFPCVLVDVVCHESFLMWCDDVVYHMSLRTRFVDVICWRRSPWYNFHCLISRSDGW